VSGDIGDWILGYWILDIGDWEIGPLGGGPIFLMNLTGVTQLPVE
jgi:hypothetical protein